MKQLVVAAAVTALVACGAMGPDVRLGNVPDGGLGSAAGGAANATGGGASNATGGGVSNATGGGSALVDAGALAAMYPSWALNDIQPSSPRATQRYGLSVFQGQPLVVVLIEGF